MPRASATTSRLVLSPSHLALLGLATLASAGFAALHTPSHLSLGATAPVLAVVIAAFASSIAGFAFAAMAGAFLFHLLPDPLQVVQIIMLCSIANQALAIWSIRRSIDIPALLPFLIPACAGVPIGAYLLVHLQTGIYLQILGVGLAAWAIY